MTDYTLDPRVIEAAARKIAGVVLEQEFEGDAESEWRHVEPLTRAALTAAFAEAERLGLAKKAEGHGGNVIGSAFDERSLFPVLIIRLGDKQND